MYEIVFKNFSGQYLATVYRPEKDLSLAIILACEFIGHSIGYVFSAQDADGNLISASVLADALETARSLGAVV